MRPVVANAKEYMDISNPCTKGYRNIWQESWNDFQLKERKETNSLLNPLHMTPRVEKVHIAKFKYLPENLLTLVLSLRKTAWILLVWSHCTWKRKTQFEPNTNKINFSIRYIIKAESFTLLHWIEKENKRTISQPNNCSQNIKEHTHDVFASMLSVCIK